MNKVTRLFILTAGILLFVIFSVIIPPAVYG